MENGKVEIRQVKTRKEKKEFINFPIKLYRNNENYVPLLSLDEMKIFDKKSIYYEDCDIITFLAYKDGKVVGRIAGIEQKSYNKKNNAKRCRFSRFDLINDEEVAKALLNAVENWAKEKGLDTVNGPLGFNDLDREGLLIEGFDEQATFEENYNAPYYKDLLEKCGYEKEIDYMAFSIIPPKQLDGRVKRISDAVLSRYDLHLAKEKHIGKFLKLYKDQIFDVIDEAYGDLYGVIPYTEGLRKSIISQFRLLLNTNCICTILDKNENVVAFGLGLPSLAKAVQKSKGRYLPFGIFRILKARKTFKVFDFALIGVRKEYLNSGINAIILQYIIEKCQDMGVERLETNHSLETNDRILHTWKNFENHRQHKRFRCFIKSI